jgi:hypothetical protein
MKNLVTFCQVSSVLSCYESNLDVLKEISKEASLQIGELEAEFGGAWRALEDNSPRAILNFIEPRVANFSRSERQEVALAMIFPDSYVIEGAPDSWHKHERRCDFIFDILDTTFSYQVVCAMYLERRTHLAEVSESFISSILKDEDVIRFADGFINYATAITTGFFDPGIDLVGRGSRGLASLLESKDIEEFLHIVSANIVKAQLLSEVGVEGTWRTLATNSANQILGLSGGSSQTSNSGSISVWLAVLEIARDNFSDNDSEEFLPNELPNLIGMKLNVAEILCEAFEIKVVVESNEKTILNKKFWKVRNTLPSPGTALKKRRLVTLEVSK